MLYGPRLPRRQAARRLARRYVCVACWQPLVDRGRFQEAEEHLSTALAMARGHAADAELVEVRHVQLQLRARQADAPGLEEILSALAEAGGTPETMAAVNVIRGYAAFLQGRFGEARHLVLDAAELAEKVGLITLAARAQRQLATTAANAGHFQLGRQHLVADFALVARSGSPMLEVGARAMVWSLDPRSPAPAEALASSKGLIALSNRIGSPRGLATSLAAQAIVHSHRGELQAARRLAAEARQVYGGNAAAVDRHIFIFVEISEAITALASGEPERARASAAAAVAAPDVLPVLGFTVMGEAEVAADNGRYHRELSAPLDQTLRGRWPAPAGSRVSPRLSPALGASAFA